MTRLGDKLVIPYLLLPVEIDLDTTDDRKLEAQVTKFIPKLPLPRQNTISWRHENQTPCIATPAANDVSVADDLHVVVTSSSREYTVPNMDFWTHYATCQMIPDNDKLTGTYWRPSYEGIPTESLDVFINPIFPSRFCIPGLAARRKTTGKGAAPL